MNLTRKMRFYPQGHEKIKWKIPGLFYNDKILFALYDACKELKIKEPFQAVFGSVTSRWCGGRISPKLSITNDEAQNIIKEYNKRNISCCFTFSNYNITEEFLKDELPNTLLEIINESHINNYAIITSDLLKNYIKKHYPNVKLISSIIKPYYDFPSFNETPDYYNKLAEEMDKVVVRAEWYLNKEFMQKLKYKDKIEIMPNIQCFYNCELAKMHYDITANYEANVDRSISPRFCNVIFNDIRNIFNVGAISNDEILDLVDMGFYNFKLKGRGADDELLMWHIIGRYIFEPTGYFQQLSKYLIDSCNYNIPKFDYERLHKIKSETKI